MPALHKIDNDIKLITTIWSGEATDTELINALLKYQQEIKSHPDYCSYNEIVDFSKASDFKLSTDGLRRLVEIAANTDARGGKTRLAIIVSAPVAYGLARMYTAYRSFVPNVSKEVHVFRNYSKALEWIAGNLMQIDD
jgi:hypothetical protein